jgi:ligand-binding sensor domain-containing protein
LDLRLILFLFFSTFTSLNLVAQQQYLFSRLHTRDGLASETVNSVQQDERGFIWIATNNGLQRYDGKSFLTFQHKEGDKNSLPYSRITWLRKDLHNRLWLLLEDNILGYFNTNDFSFHQVPGVHRRRICINLMGGCLQIL